MARHPNEEHDLQLAEKLIFGGSGLVLQRYALSETLEGRTPDFRVLRDGKLVAYCEVKSPRDDWLDEQIECAPAGEIAGGLRPDRTFDRLARHVKKAASQFDAVNAARKFPNILVLVNHVAASNFADLHETLTGSFYGDTGKCYPTVRHISEGRIGVARTRIDLYAWVSKEERAQYLFNSLMPPHVKAICDLLHIDVPTED